MSTEVVKQEKFTEIIPLGAGDAQKFKLSVQMVQTLIAVKTKKGNTCSDVDAIKFIAMCSARRLNPFEGDAYLIGYDTQDGPKFSLITAHQAFLKRAELNSEYDGMQSGIIVQRDNQLIELQGDFFLKGDELMGGWATVFFKTRSHPMHKKIRLQRFQKSFGVWQDDPAGMICKCAEADALRSSFPTMLGGLYLKEEMPSEPTIKVTAPIFDTPPAPDKEEKPKPEPDTKKEKAAKVVEEKKAEPEKQDSGIPTEVSEILTNLKFAGVTEDKAVDALQELGVIGSECKSIQDIFNKNPAVFELLKTQIGDIIEKIKSK